MQFRHMEARLEHKRASLPHVDLERLRATIAHEYEQFTATLAKWTQLTDAWYHKTREQLSQRLEESRFRREARELAAELRMQHRRLQLLGAQLA